MEREDVYLLLRETDMFGKWVGIWERREGGLRELNQFFDGFTNQGLKSDRGDFRRFLLVKGGGRYKECKGSSVTSSGTSRSARMGMIFWTTT